MNNIQAGQEDRLVDMKTRREHGMFYTPLPACKLALDYIANRKDRVWLLRRNN